ncbi:MAG: glycosyltransferase family 2 protein [Spirochaetota bacterium]|nr:glycosyltransferase family 2 protein [Spirochaetota bacterium]
MEIDNPYDVNSAELIVGIPSYNEADNISFVVEKCNEGLRKYFPNYKSVIINVDNNSPDDTRSVFLNSVNTIPKIYISTPLNVKGKGNNFYNLFKESVRLRAKVIVVVDADITSITPEWIPEMINPIIKDRFDFVTPLYSRNEYDGTITNNICYPLIMGIMGKDIRQPIGGDFALSNTLGKYILDQTWHDTTRQYGIDIFLTLNAIIGNFRTCQVELGAKIHKPSAPKLGSMFTQVVGTMFETVLQHKNSWNNLIEVEELPLYGKNKFAEPQKLSVDYKTMKEIAISEFINNQEILVKYLSSEIYCDLCKMFNSGKIDINMDLWTMLIYDLLYAYDISVDRVEIIEAMKPLYFGRVITFYRETLDMDHYACEVRIQQQSRHFFNSRNYLINKYEDSRSFSVN